MENQFLALICKRNLQMSKHKPPHYLTCTQSFISYSLNFFLYLYQLYTNHILTLLLTHSDKNYKRNGMYAVI